MRLLAAAAAAIGKSFHGGVKCARATLKAKVTDGEDARCAGLDGTGTFSSDPDAEESIILLGTLYSRRRPGMESWLGRGGLML